MLICRTHGEPLRRDLPTFSCRCPEITVCGTWVGDEYIERAAE